MLPRPSLLRRSRRWRQIGPVTTRSPSVPTRTTTPGALSLRCVASAWSRTWRRNRTLWWFCHRWAHHTPRGLRYVDQRPPRHREVFWLDQAVGRSAPDQAGRHRQVECGVWAVRDRLQTDPAEQPAQPGHGRGMISLLHSGVTRRRPPGSPNGANCLNSTVLSH